MTRNFQGEDREAVMGRVNLWRYYDPNVLNQIVNILNIDKIREYILKFLTKFYFYVSGVNFSSFFHSNFHNIYF